MSSRRPTEPAPVTIPGYVIVDRINAGGFSVVYRARQVSMNRDVAVKVLNAGFTSEAEQRTFERECHVLGRLSGHPHIVTVFDDAMTADGRPCIVMELYDSTYRDRIAAEGAQSIEDTLSTGVHIADALQAVHDQNVLHRDVKPHNVFISQYGSPALGDFGISTIDDERSQSMSSALSVAYAAPEVLEDGPVGRSADIYGLGATLYHLVTGERPFASADIRTTVRRIVSENPPPVERADAPPGLSRVLARAMAKDPADRPRTAIELAENLREVQARVGLPRTRMLAEAPVVIERPPPVAVGEAPAARVPASAPAAPVAVRPDAVASDEATTTRARRAPVAPPAAVDAVPPDRRRAWVGLGVAVAALLALVLAATTLAGGDDPSTAPTTTARRPDPVFILAAPADVQVVASGPGSFSVSFGIPEEAEEVQLRIVSGPDTGQVLTFESSPATVPTSAASLCVVARSVAGDGRVSSDTEPACSG